MKKHQLRPVLAVFALFIYASSSWAATATWTNTAATNAWETAGNWNPATVPNINTVDVTIPIAAPCNFSSDFQIGALNLSVASAKLNLIPGSRLVIDNAVGLNNNGTIVVNTTGANSTTSLRFDVSCPITGTGSIQLKVAGIVYNIANFDLNGHTVTIGAGQILHGDGTVFSNTGLLINNGTINGDDASGIMQLDFTGNDGVLHKNNGTIKATNGGILGLYSGIVDQTGGGSFLADGAGSVVQLGSNNLATIIGGSLNTANNGIFQVTPGGAGALLTSSTNNGVLQIPGGEVLFVRGTGLTNNGAILVNSTDPVAITSSLQFDESGTLGGSGTVTLHGVGFNRANLKSTGGSTITIGANETVRGYGTIFGDGLLFNNGTIIGDDPSGNSMQLDLPNNSTVNKNTGTLKAINGGVLGLYSGIMDQTGGGSFLADGVGSLVQLGGSGASPVVISGTLNTANGGIIQLTPGGQGVLLTSSTNNGTLQVPAGNNPLFVAGSGLTNNGTILVNTTAANTTTKIIFQADGTLGGTGSVTLNGNGSFNIADLDCNGHNVINGANHTIKGNGDIFMNGGVLTNNGTIAPGQSAGQLNVFGNLVLGSTSNLSMEIGGTTAATQHDVLNKADAAQLVLAGTLSVRLINGFTPAASNTFTIVTTQTALGGAFSNVATGHRLNNADGSGSFVVTYSGNNVVLSSFEPISYPSQLLNISTRLNVQPGDNRLIGGFIVTGTAAKRVIVRALGPSLNVGGVPVPGRLANTTLQLVGPGGVIATNDNWRTGGQEAQIIASTVPPPNDLESAIVANLPANSAAYSVIVEGVGNTSGVGSVEVYDLDQTADSQLANISTRGLVQTGDSVMIGGFIVGGPGGGNARLIVRAIGPSLNVNGVPLAGRLPDTTLEIANQSGMILFMNDNWRTGGQEAEIIATTVPPPNDLESAIVATLAPGAYTAIVRGKNNTAGVGLVEAFNLP